MISVQFNLSAISERINEIKLAWISWTYLFKFNTSKNAFFKRNQLHFSKLLQAYFLNWVSFKVHIFWEGHKFLRNFHRRFVLCSNGSNLRWRFGKILWPSQNIWTLSIFFAKKTSTKNSSWKEFGGNFELLENGSVNYFKRIGFSEWFTFTGCICWQTGQWFGIKSGDHSTRWRALRRVLRIWLLRGRDHEQAQQKQCTLCLFAQENT